MASNRRRSLYRRPNMFDMLKNEEGHRLLVNKLRTHVKNQPWANISRMIEALDQDRLFIPAFHTIYDVNIDGKFP